MMPTDLEKAGDFSQTVDVSNKMIVVKDPTTGIALPGNKMSPSQIDPNGQALLKVLPAPNFFDRTISGGQYNYVYQAPLERPQRLHTMKIDYSATSNDAISLTWSRQEDKQTGTIDLATPSPNWPMEYRTFVTRGNIVTARYQKVLSPTLVNELSVAKNWRWEAELIPQDELDKYTRAKVGFNTPQLYPNSNPLNLLPNVSWGGITNAASLTLTNIPLEALYTTYIVTDNITKSYQNHIFKAGIFYNRPAVNSTATTNRGTISFATDVNNPLETGYTYANSMFVSSIRSRSLTATSSHPRSCRRTSGLCRTVGR